MVIYRILVIVAKRMGSLLAVLLMALLAGCAPEYNVTKTPVPPPPQRLAP